MPYTPPDPGRVARHLAVIRDELGALEQLYADAHDPFLALLFGELRSGAEKLEQYVSAKSTKK